MRILLGLALGALAGLLLAAFSPGSAQVLSAAIEPIGRVWLNALQMTVVPLVVALVILGITTASDAFASGRVARRAMIVIVLILSGAAAFTAVVAPLLLSFVPRDPALIETLRHAFSSPAGSQAVPALGDWIAGLVPNNVISAAAQSAMLPLVVFAMLFGFALTRVDAARRGRFLELVQTGVDALIAIVRWVLWAAPVGVFALIFTVCARVGAGMLQALGTYLLLQCSIYLALTLLLYAVATLAGRERLRRFALAILPAQVIAASTQSSLASLPAMVESAEVRLGYPRAVTSLVLPMAVALCRVTSPAQYLGVAAFIAWVYGIDLGAAQLAAGAALAVVISMGAVGLPGQVSFMATNLPVAQSMGLPLEPLGLLLAVDTVPDVFATVGNVTADLTATSVVARQEAADEVGAPAPERSPA